MIITANGLTKIFRKYDSEDSLLELAKNFVLRRYNDVAAVKDVTFTIEPGTCVGLLGSNGAGKTTLIKMLAGLLVPTGGEASVMGFTPWERRDSFLRQIGVVMGQRQQLWIDVSASENLKLNQVVYGIPPAEFKKRVRQLSEMLGVEKLLDVQVRKLSLGEKMKMELLAAFLHRPKLLFLDESTIGLDVVAQNRIREFIHDRVHQDGVSVLLTSHYMKDLEELCPRVLLIQSGKLVHDGPLASLAGKLGRVKRILFFSTEELGKRFAGRPVSRRDDGHYFIEVDSTEVSSVVRELVNKAGIDDLTIESPPIEESVREIFTQETSQKDTKAKAGS